MEVRQENLSKSEEIESTDNNSFILEIDNTLDPISLNSILEIEDPVLSPYTGHIYEKAGLQEALRNNPIDPIAKKPLKPNQVISGRHIKPLLGAVNELKVKQESMASDLKELSDTVKLLVARNNDSDLKIETLTKKVNNLEAENQSLKQEKEQLNFTIRNLESKCKTLEEENRNLLLGTTNSTRYVSMPSDRENPEANLESAITKQSSGTETIESYSNKQKAAVVIGGLTVLTAALIVQHSSLFKPVRAAGEGLVKKFGDDLIQTVTSAEKIVDDIVKDSNFTI